MVNVSDLESTVKDYLSGDYEVTETSTLPTIEDISFGKKAKKIKLCAFCIDMRKSSDLLFVHHKQTCGKIHKAFLTIASKVVLDYGGEIRSFNGDGLLAFWPVILKIDVARAVRAAMVTKYLIDVKFSSLFEQYSKIDFGIGIDFGDVYILRAGIPRNTNNNDLIFIGTCVNFATAIANQAHGPGHVEISEITYKNLEEDMIYGTQFGSNVNMWRNGIVEWKGERYPSKLTSWHIEID